MALIISQSGHSGKIPNNLPFTKYNYFNLRNTVWQFLIDYKIDRLPIDTESLLKKLNIIYNVHILDYNQLKEGTFLERRKDKAFSVVEDNDIIIAHKPELELKVLNFTLAHELGHLIFLGNIDRTNYEKKQICLPQDYLCPLLYWKKLM